MNKKIKITSFVLAILLGIFFIVFGGYDDSPGGQFIGLIILIFGIAGIIKSRKKVAV